MASKEKHGSAAHLCALCSHAERTFFCPLLASADRHNRRDPPKVPHHDSLANLMKSASDGCELCKVLLYGYLQAQENGVNKPHAHPRTLTEYYLEQERFALSANAEEHGSSGIRPFYLILNEMPFLVPIQGENSHRQLGFVSLILDRFHSGQSSWGKRAIFIITSSPGSQACLEGRFYGRAITPRPDLKFAQDLLRECRISHNCTPIEAISRRQMPTRLLFLQDEGTERHPSLTLVDGDPHQSYLALSHRWGKAIDCITRVENIDERKANLDFNLLPQTFKDAALVTLALGYTYLWIDCLCIVQDDPHDWEMECPRMAHIYGNADLTIAAVDAADSYSGFLRTRESSNAENSCRLRYRGRDKSRDDVITIEYGSGEDRLKFGFRNILDQRGWALQERILSDRLLSFSKDKLIWECKAECRLETLHFQGTESRQRFTAKKDIGSLDKEGIFRWWYDVLANYCTRDLAFHADKLPAISGIAARVQEMSGDTYFAGLWQNDLARGLAWKAEFTRDNFAQVQSYAPSWSWASSDYCLTGARLYGLGSNEGTITIHSYIQLITANIDIRGEDPYGHVNPGSSLKIRAPTKNAILGPGKSSRTPWIISNHIDVILKAPYTTHEVPLSVSIDSPQFRSQILDRSLVTDSQWSQELEGLHVTAVPLCTLESSDMKFPPSYGLILLSTEDGAAFKRVGFLEQPFPVGTRERGGKTEMEKWFADAEMQELTLV